MKHEAMSGQGRGVSTGQLTTGLNPYGLTYLLGLQGAGTPRANPEGTGLDGFIEVAIELGFLCPHWTTTQLPIRRDSGQHRDPDIFDQRGQLCDLFVAGFLVRH